MAAENNGEDARKRLLDASEFLFAEKGFAGTSVREIVKRAGCNIAAVNYHFGTKDNLYRDVFLRFWGEMKAARVNAIREVMDDRRELATLERLLRNFATMFMETMPMEGEREIFNLFMREMIDPQLPRDLFFTEFLSPVKKEFRGAIGVLCPSLGDDEVELCINSFVGQLRHVGHDAKCFGVHKEENKLYSDKEWVVEHIVRFTMAGIETYLGEVQDGE